MALNTGFTELDASTNTFSDWLSKTNTMINLMRDEVMTANSTYANTTGDARLFGTFVANTVVVPDELRGGDSDASANLSITSNVSVTGTFSADAFETLLPVADETQLGNSSFQWEGYFSNVYISGVLSVPTVTSDIIGTLEGDLTGDVYNADGVIVLDSGTNSVAASYTGSVTGNVVGNITSTGTSTFSSIDVNGGTIDNTPIGQANPVAGSFTTLTSSSGITGDLTGDVTGNLTGDVTANAIVTEYLTANNVLGNLDVEDNITANTVTATFVGNLTGDVTANTIDVEEITTPSANLYLNSATQSVEIRGDSNTAQIVLNGAGNAYRQSIRPQLTSVTNILTLPAGNDQELVGTTASQTLSNKNITANSLFGTVQSLTGSGAVNLTDVVTEVTTSGGAAALTLADGTNGQIKVVTMVSDDGNDATLTPTTPLGYSSIVFNDAGDTVTLMYSSSGWVISGIFGANTA